MRKGTYRCVWVHPPPVHGHTRRARPPPGHHVPNAARGGAHRQLCALDVHFQQRYSFHLVLFEDGGESPCRDGVRPRRGCHPPCVNPECQVKQWSGKIQQPPPNLGLQSLRYLHMFMGEVVLRRHDRGSERMQPLWRHDVSASLRGAWLGNTLEVESCSRDLMNTRRSALMRFLCCIGSLVPQPAARGKKVMSMCPSELPAAALMAVHRALTWPWWMADS